MNLLNGIKERNSNKRIDILITLLKLFFMSWALVKVASLDVTNIFSLIFPALGYLLTIKTREYISKDLLNNKSMVLISTFAFLFSLFYTLVDHYGWSMDLDNKLFKAVVVLSVFLGLILWFKDILVLAIMGLNRLSEMVFKESDEVSGKKLGIITTVICLVCWMPYFLYLYPGVMTPDSINQLEQAMGMVEYSNHHPWIHTLIIKLWFNIGTGLGGSNNLGIALYTLFQMIIGGVSFGYVSATLNRLKIKKWFIYLTIAFYALVPYNAVFAVTVWKDVLFGYLVVVFVTSLLNLYLDLSDEMEGAVETEKETPKPDRNRLYGMKIITLIVFTLSGIMVCLLRSNGLYGFILSSVIIIILIFIKVRRILPLASGMIITMLIISLVIKGPVMNAFNVEQPDFVEMLSVPLQQVANVIIKNDDINSDDMELITNVIDTTYIDVLYEPTFADNIKELVRAGHPEYLEAHKKEYLGLYLRLFIKYPRDYLDAYIGQTSGYWYPESRLRVADCEGVIDNQCGVYFYPLIRGKLVVKTKEILLKLGSMLPVYGSIWSVGTVFWMVMAMLLYAIVKNNTRYIIFIPIISIVLTVLIATPVSGNFRYVYFMVLSLPLLLGASLKRM